MDMIFEWMYVWKFPVNRLLLIDLFADHMSNMLCPQSTQSYFEFNFHFIALLNYLLCAV